MRRASPTALLFLRGRDADGRLSELTARRARLRPVLGALAAVFLERRAYEGLGFRGLGDWSRERLGVGARGVREWARVGRALLRLPRLRVAVVSGRVSWTVARRIVALVTPENEEACVATVEGRSVRAVEALRAAIDAGRGSGEPAGEAIRVHIRCSAGAASRWAAAIELARRVAGEELPIWECAEAIAAECTSATGAPELPDLPRKKRGVPASQEARSTEAGLRADAWPRLAWPVRRVAKAGWLPRLGARLRREPPRQLDRRFREAIGFLQQVDLEIGRVLAQVVDRRLYRELGFESFERYVEERLEFSPRTARRLVRLARSPQLANAFREGRITLLQAEVLLRGGTVQRAEQVTLRRLEQEVRPYAVDFWAPGEVALLFLALVQRFGLEAMLEHAIATWRQAGRAFRGYADFERDGWRCTVPCCTARRNLQSHHIRFRSAGGPDLPWNRTTLCAFHHLRGVHAGTVSIRGRAPHALVYELGIGRFASGDEWL